MNKEFSFQNDVGSLDLKKFDNFKNYLALHTRWEITKKFCIERNIPGETSTSSKAVFQSTF